MENKTQPLCEHCQSPEHTTEQHQESDYMAAIWPIYLSIASSDDEKDQELADELIDDLN